MADTSQDNNESEKQGERFSRNRGRGSGSKNRDAYFKHNDRRNYGSSSSRGSNYHSNHGGFRDSNFGRKPYKRIYSHSQADGKRKRLEVGNRLKEPDIGVTEFIGDHHGFSGLLKERFSDFHVNEISLDGEIAKLTNQIIPSESDDSNNLEHLKKDLPDTVWEQLQKLKDEESSCSSIEIDVTDLDKDKRRIIHDVTRLLTNINSKTIDQDGKKLMIIMKNSKKGSRYPADERVNWKKLGGDYCYFSLHKVNMDTMEALNRMSKILRIQPNNFNYAGTKDRRAWTTQWVSLKKVHPTNILRAGRAIRGTFVGNFKFAKEPLKLGMLSGNRFRIAIRNVTASDEEIEKVMISLRDRGFINYYGLQRFGTVAAIPTHEIGKKLLQGKWLEAIDLILKPREGEHDTDLAEARKIYETTKNASEAYNRIRNSEKIEAALLKGLQMYTEKNPQGVLDMIPRNTRLMYIHAYQSFVWNHMISRRIKEFGTRPIVGDLVLENDRDKKSPEDNGEHLCQDSTEDTCLESDDANLVKKENEEETEMVCEADNKDDEDVKELVDDTKEETNVIEAGDEEDSIDDKKEDTEAIECSDQKDSIDDIKEVTSATESGLNIKEKPDDNNTAGDKEEEEDNHDVPSVRILTEEDLANYTLADIIMPLPGWKVNYPPYAKSWYDEFLAKDELTTSLRQRNKKYSLGGTYRKILQIPLDLSWKIMHYKDKHDNLIACDFDEMRKMVPPKDNPEGENKALIIEMSLRASTYATMALREILRHDTSPQAQAAQSAAHDALLESNKAAADKAETSNSNNEDIQETNVDKEPEACDNVDEKMDVDSVPEEPSKDITEPEKETQVEPANDDVEMKEVEETTKNDAS
ncbi:hypothetical protein KPH14_008051 [Odynerus spinipes]|uniref:Pseudouridylate synthase 7 homolog n=1 Tax=Odynerus spinipes TaxID=1348599 RepID=A0AAD9RKE0_9HYME|nr:hypothetical protein KPH14_008051 [Odynerus spinipes]